MDSDAGLQVIAENLASSTRRVLGELGVSRSNVNHYLNIFGKRIWKYRNVRNISKILQNFRLALVQMVTDRGILTDPWVLRWLELLSLRFFGLLSSSLLLFPQRFGRYVLRSSSGVCRTREPSRNFELRPLLNPRGSPVLIQLAITGYKC